MSNAALTELGPGWEHVKALGSGSFGSVQLFRHVSTQALFAVKFVERGELVDEAIKKEVVNHCMLSHENIARFREVILRPRHLAIVMEYAQGGDLFNAVQQAKGHRMNEPMARYFFQQLIAGLGYMHSQGMCHRDLKLENLLLSDNPPKLKLCDFGYSKSSKWQSQAKSKVGTAAYIAPEVITASKGSKYDAEMVDVWSSGVVLHTMLVGMYPFCDTAAPNDETRTIRHILSYWKGDSKYQPPRSVSAECLDILSRMLTANPQKRMKIGEILTHPWFQVNLPRGCSINPSPPSETFYQQPLTDIQRILDVAVQPTLGALNGVPEVPEAIAEEEEDEQAQLNPADSSVSLLSQGCSLTLAESGLESVMMMAASGMLDEFENLDVSSGK